MNRIGRSRTDLQALIRKLDARCRARAAGEVDDATPPDSWAAVLFRVRDRLFLTPLEQLAEVLDLPADVTRIPGAKPWLLGIANNRGTLLPIFDLATLIENSGPRARRLNADAVSERRRERRSRERVLVVRQEQLPCGLVVSEAVGMRYVRNGDRVDQIPDGLGASGPYVQASYLLDGSPVPVIHLGQLVGDPLLNAKLA